MKEYTRLQNINAFVPRAKKTAFLEEMRKRLEGKTITYDKNDFASYNPFFNPLISLHELYERYEVLYDYIDTSGVTSVLEIGCSFGMSTWLMEATNLHVVGLDLDCHRISIAKAVFPEIDFVCEDYVDHLPGKHYDLIVAAYAPINIDLFLQHSHAFLHIGYRPSNLTQALTWSHKHRGRHLSMDATLITRDGSRGIAPSYFKYFFRKNYFSKVAHALRHGYAFPL